MGIYDAITNLYWKHVWNVTGCLCGQHLQDFLQDDFGDLGQETYFISRNIRKVKTDAF